LLALYALAPGTAHAQDSELIGDVSISFEVGELDPTAGDWTIDAVEVSGELEEGREFTITLLNAGGGTVWTGSAAYTDPITTIEVSEPVFVGEVASAGVEQGITVVGGVQIEPPIVEWSAGGGAGGGDLALSMVLAVFLVALVFRTPLPSATVARWTK
jgi:hypothetical protein